MDASVGLTFSLQLFQRYRRSGILQAKVRHISGIQGACMAYVHLTAGAVTACYLEDKQGQHLSFPLENLCQIDRERGPFTWIFQPQHPASRSQVPVSPSAQPLTSTSSLPAELDVFIPKAVAPLRWEQFKDWTHEQRVLLQYVWKSIDGKRTIQDVKASLPYPPPMVNDILQILLTLRIIVLTS
jgi:hypothetical protein